MKQPIWLKCKDDSPTREVMMKFIHIQSLWKIMLIPYEYHEVPIKSLLSAIKFLLSSYYPLVNVYITMENPPIF